MAVSIEELEEREADQLDFFSGSIATRFMAGATATLPTIRDGEDSFRANLSADCGTYYMGCPNATQDPANCPTADVAAPSCGLCPSTLCGDCPSEESVNSCPRPHDTTTCAPPDSASCAPPDTTSCSDSSDGSCQTPSTEVGCYSTYTGC
jgi:hypothetical protein